LVLRGIIATPWSGLSLRSLRLHYRGKMGIILDATGFKVEMAEHGRLKENRIFASFEVGVKCLGTNRTGMLYERISYVRSIYSFHSSGDSPDLGFDSDSVDRIFLDIGILI